MFAASLSMLMLTMVVQRPEEIIHSITGTKRFEAYTSDVKLAYTNKKHINVIMVNPSNYTSIQKVIGYDAANRLLKCVAERIDKTCKTCKVDADIYYLDRGRFRIVLSHNNKKKTEELAEQINTALKSEFDLNEFDLSLRAYVCVVRLPEEINNFSELMRFGSTVHETVPYSGNVLYASDILNKSRVTYSDQLDNIIEKAIVNKNFKVYYQPIYSVAEERFTTAEALLRLIDDEYGFIPPDVFITAAEKSGAIHRIGDYVLEEVCRFIASDEFKKLGLDYIEINLSVAQCMQKDLCDKVLDIVKKYNVSTSQINLEITETAANYAQDVLTENLQKLTEAGISLSLDDYGTGYSNIKRVASLPLTIVKLDKTFVNEVDDPRMWIVLKNTIKMLKEMDIQIVVEGIETEKLKDKFSALKCEFIQGYYFSRPLPEQDFSIFILNA